MLTQMPYEKLSVFKQSKFLPIVDQSNFSINSLANKMHKNNYKKKNGTHKIVANLWKRVVFLLRANSKLFYAQIAKGKLLTEKQMKKKTNKQKEISNK